jgi:hypothetical protein
MRESVKIWSIEPAGELESGQERPGRPSFVFASFTCPLPFARPWGGGGGRYQHSKLQPQRTRDLPKGLSLGGERTVPYVDYYYRRSKKSNPISTSFSFPPAGET